MDIARNKSSVILLAIIVGLLLLSNQTLKRKNRFLEQQLTTAISALREANDNTEEANSRIEDANSYAWSSYDEMGEALESLEGVETIDITLRLGDLEY